ncbi:MAG: hypothetical protein HRT58_12035 [Crocinitomicaceae bacterium]|nr:hypothetical protein [Flavobacteriales bacterium]NQZ36390.1 hypothetical protein [Crocinitomicaceae bacterium]
MKLILSLILFSTITLTSFSQASDDTTVMVSTFYPKDQVEYKPLLGKIKNGEEFNLTVESSGCFHRSTYKLNIKKTENKYFAEYNGKTIQLNQKEIEAVKKFENELKKPRHLFCTTTETYMISYLGQSQTVVDGSCSWKGFHNLIGELSFN